MYKTLLLLFGTKTKFHCDEPQVALSPHACPACRSPAFPQPLLRSVSVTELGTVCSFRVAQPLAACRPVRPLYTHASMHAPPSLPFCFVHTGHITLGIMLHNYLLLCLFSTSVWNVSSKGVGLRCCVLLTSRAAGTRSCLA